MGCGASRIYSYKWKSDIENDDSLSERDEQLCNFEELDFYNRLKDNENMGYIRAYSNLCGNSYLLSIWDLILDCESTLFGKTETKALCDYLLPYDKTFPMVVDLLGWFEKVDYDKPDLVKIHTLSW